MVNHFLQVITNPLLFHFPLRVWYNNFQGQICPTIVARIFLLQLGTSLELKQFDLMKKDEFRVTHISENKHFRGSHKQVTWRCSEKNLVLKDFANFTENTYDAESFQNKVSSQHHTTFWRKHQPFLWVKYTVKLN